MGHENVLFAKKIKENTLHSHIVLFFCVSFTGNALGNTCIFP